ncbi:hypothetical protein [Hominisplanchenecus sp.]|uniref:hypothetical protein n=1 Tax=Hominisplanchenecus sp. TaxID=3038130 RepID=UPI00399370C3
MKKKVIAVISGVIILVVAAGSIYGKTSSDREPDDPDVVSSSAMNRDESLTVVANRNKITDKEAFAKQLLKMCRDNSFHSIKFSTDHGYATSLDVSVYFWKEDVENGKPVMKVEYRPVEYGKEYDIVHDPDKFRLFVDGEEIAE